MKKTKKDDSIQTFQMDEEAFLYLNFNETPQPSLREIRKNGTRDKSIENQ